MYLMQHLINLVMEKSVQITESVRGQDVFIIQPTCAPTNDNFNGIINNGRCT